MSPDNEIRRYDFQPGQPQDRVVIELLDVQTNYVQYPEVNAVIHLFLEGVQAILGELLVGMYLHGSLASGGFNPESSDIDFVVVTSQPISGEMLPRLADMHKLLVASGLKWATRLEGAYISSQAIRCYNPGKTSCAWLGSDGHFAVETLGNDWVIQSYVIRELGVVITGPDPKTLIEPILPEDLRKAGLATLHWWWAPQLENPFRLQSCEYQAYAVLTMCRALYTLQFGRVVSKPVAALWAQAELDERWVALIERSLTWREGEGGDDLGEALEFIRYTLERTQLMVW